MWLTVLVLVVMAKSSSDSTRTSAPARRQASPARAPKSPARNGAGSGGAPPERPSAIATFYRAHRSEIWGLVACLLALLCALGIYGGLGGLVGSAFRRAAGVSVGWGRLAVPPALAAVGVLLISGRGAPDDDAGGERHPSVRILGGCLVLAALAGILHLAAGRPTWGDGLAEFEDAGGYLGFASGGALALLAGVAGAVVILLALGLLGWLAISGMPISTVAHGTWRVLRRIGTALGTLARLIVAERGPAPRRSPSPAARTRAPTTRAGPRPLTAPPRPLRRRWRCLPPPRCPAARSRARASAVRVTPSPATARPTVPQSPAGSASRRPRAPWRQPVTTADRGAAPAWGS